MPVYRWEGIDITGSTCSGKEESQSHSELERALRARGIAMLQAKKSFFDVRRQANPKGRINELLFFSNLAELLDAGLFVSDAIALMASQQKEKAPWLRTLREQLQKGIPLSKAIEPFAVNPLIISLVRAGEETASLPKATKLIAQFVTQRHEFRSRIKAAIYMPVITLGFFVLMMIVIVFGLVPKIVDLFPPGTPLPRALRLLHSIGEHARQPAAIIGLLLCASGIGLLLFWLRTAGKLYLDAAALRIPIIRTWVLDRNLANLLTSLGIMLEGGIPVSRALPIASQSLTNMILRNKFHAIAESVEMGTPLSQVIQEKLNLDELAAIMALGEQTGRLGQLVTRTAHWYEKKCADFLLVITQVIQPTLIILLGLGIAGLIASVYLPILELAQGIPQGI